MKLHLGCGERYLPGYINIDYPASEHTVQQSRVCDQEADLLSLQYAAESVEEVRLHHVFEHFTRPVACALLTSWYSWMPAAGILHIEVPDFGAAARRALGLFTSEQGRCVAERHIFGSQEAHWAVHCIGYTEARLRGLLEAFGFIPQKVNKSEWRGTDNLEIVAQRSAGQLTFADFEQRTKDYLSLFLVDDSESEKRLLEVWINLWREQALRGWALGND